MKGKKYSSEEWEAAQSLKKLGLTWEQVCGKIGRKGDTLGRTIVKYDGNYEDYLASYQRGKKPARKTEQLRFIPPELPAAPKRVTVAPMSEDDLTRKKLAMATRQAQICKRFVEELRDAGFRF